MKFIIRINEQDKFDFFMNLLDELDFVEIIDVKEEANISSEHKALLDNRLAKIEQGKSTFKNWNEIKKKYEPI